MSQSVIPAKAGIPDQDVAARLHETPASAGVMVRPWI